MMSWRYIHGSLARRLAQFIHATIDERFHFCGYAVCVSRALYSRAFDPYLVVVKAMSCTVQFL